MNRKRLGSSERRKMRRAKERALMSFYGVDRSFDSVTLAGDWITGSNGSIYDALLALEREIVARSTT